MLGCTESTSITTWPLRMIMLGDAGAPGDCCGARNGGDTGVASGALVATTSRSASLPSLANLAGGAGAAGAATFIWATALSATRELILSHAAKSTAAETSVVTKSATNRPRLVRMEFMGAPIGSGPIRETCEV